MRLLFAAAGTALALTWAMPITAHAQNVQQLLKGLTTGNQSQDQALQDAFQRGYQKGRQDEAQSEHSGSEHSGRGESSNRGSRQLSPNDNRDYNNGNDNSRAQPSYSDQGNNGYSRDQGNNGYAR